MNSSGFITVYCEETSFEYRAIVTKISTKRIRVYLDEADMSFWLDKEDERYVGSKLGLSFITKNCVIN